MFVPLNAIVLRRTARQERPIVMELLDCVCVYLGGLATHAIWMWMNVKQGHITVVATCVSIHKAVSIVNVNKALVAIVMKPIQVTTDVFKKFLFNHVWNDMHKIISYGII